MAPVPAGDTRAQSLALGLAGLEPTTWLVPPYCGSSLVCLFLFASSSETHSSHVHFRLFGFLLSPPSSW